MSELAVAKHPAEDPALKKRKRPKSAENKNKNKKKKGEGAKPATRMTWTNKQRALVFAARGITFHARHLMNDLKVLMPHSKSDSKLERKEGLYAINEICEMKNCNMTMFFEMRKKLDLYMWMSMVPNGPSARFLVQNVHTMDELRLTGNHLKGSRPLITFNKAFDEQPYLALLKEMLKQVDNLLILRSINSLQTISYHHLILFPDVRYSQHSPQIKAVLRSRDRVHLSGRKNLVQKLPGIVL